MRSQGPERTKLVKLTSGEIAGIMFSWDMRNNSGKNQRRSLGSFISGSGTGFSVSSLSQADFLTVFGSDSFAA